jgi:hypothetical protein
MGIFKNRWTKWQDISVGLFSSHPYLLQARRNNSNGKVQFRVSSTRTGAYNCIAPTLDQLKQLEDESKIS